MLNYKLRNVFIFFGSDIDFKKWSFLLDCIDKVKFILGDCRIINLSNNGGMIDVGNGIFVSTQSISNFDFFCDDIFIVAGSIATDPSNHLLDNIDSILKMSCNLSSFEIEVLKIVYGQLMLELNRIYPSNDVSRIFKPLKVISAFWVIELPSIASQNMRNKNFDRRSSANESYAGVLQQQKWEELEFWIKENITGQLTVEKLSDYMSMSTRTFTRQCKKRFEVTPKKLVERIRLELALEMISDGKLPLSSVAGLCGYVRNENMQRAFIRYLGINPSSIHRCKSA